METPELAPLVYHSHKGWQINDEPLPGLRPDATIEQVVKAVSTHLGRAVKKVQSVNDTWCDAGSCRHHVKSFLPSRSMTWKKAP